LRIAAGQAVVSLRDGPGPDMNAKIAQFGRFPLAFTLTPHLQPINYHGRFSPFGGI
jgi:hypothetical protein